MTRKQNSNIQRIDIQPTSEQIAEIEAASRRPVVYDEDCPRIDPDETPARYQALLAAVEERNKRMAEMMRSSA